MMDPENKDTNEAIDKIIEIHRHLSRSGLYKGYKPVVVAASGLIGIIAAFIQKFFISDNGSFYFVIYWAAAAVINLILCSIMILYQYFSIEDDFERKKTLTVMMQFVPMVICGIIVTFFFLNSGIIALSLLPGIWAILFALGIFNVRPYLTNLTILAGVYYIICSVVLFYLGCNIIKLMPLGMALTFGIGQFVSAFVLYWSIEKDSYDKKK